MAASAVNVGDDPQAQIDEIEALSSIYGDDWCVIDEASRIFCIKISDNQEHPKWTLCLQIVLPPEYPTAAPPMYQLNAPWLRGPERMELSNSLEELYAENLGESILYLWVERIREFLVEKSHSADSADGLPLTKTTEEVDDDLEDEFIREYNLLKLSSEQNSVQIFSKDTGDEELPPIKHGEPVTDRRSTFQAHLAPVVTLKQVKMVLNKLHQNKKIGNATHNIYAYRIYCEDKQTFIQDCEDDGETAAGGRLLHLLQGCAYTRILWRAFGFFFCTILDVRNVMVVVSRWYGGILLGPDRFKHINNCARNILVDENYTESGDDSAKAGGKSKKQRNKKGR